MKNPLVMMVMMKSSTHTCNVPFQVQDAQATMRLYTLVKKQWEAEIKASKTNQNSQMKNERKPK